MAGKSYVLNEIQFNALKKQNEDLISALSKLAAKDKKIKTDLHSVLGICMEQQKILGDAEIIDVESSPNKYVRKNVTGQADEYINADYMCQNFGTHYFSQVSYYDFDKNIWSSYMYSPTSDDLQKNQNAKKIKSNITQYPVELFDRYSLAGMVIMPIKQEWSVWNGKICINGKPDWVVENPKFDNKGSVVVVGNLILRNKITGVLKEVPDRWMVVGVYADRFCAERSGMDEFMNLIINNRNFLNKISEIHTH